MDDLRRLEKKTIASLLLQWTITRRDGDDFEPWVKDLYDYIQLPKEDKVALKLAFGGE